MNLQCLRCKGRNFCNRNVCVIYQKISFQKKFNEKAKKDFFGASHNVFIGRFGYPNINVGILNVENSNEQYDNPHLWSNQNYDISKIIELRSSLINSNFKANVTGFKSFKDRFLEVSKEVSLAKNPVDVEVSLNKKPQFSITFNQDSAPFGPVVRLEKARITENPKIPSKLDKVVDDTDLKANSALNLLYKTGFDEHYLTKIFSMGNLGFKTERRLVPTRWSITAVDDTLGKNLISTIKEYNHMSYTSYFGGFLGNYYLLLFFPEVWSYELFETLVSTQGYTTDYEDFYGRKDYAYETAGGYYAARIAILEKLNELKKQGSVLALRFITDDYWAPLGVWVVRESTRKAMNSKPLEFGSKELMLRYADVFIKKKFGIDITPIISKSKILKNMNQQKKLLSFA